MLAHAAWLHQIQLLILNCMNGIQERNVSEHQAIIYKTDTKKKEEKGIAL